MALNDTAGMFQQRDFDLAGSLTLGNYQGQGAIFLVFVLDTAAYAQLDVFVVQFLEIALAHPFCSPFVRARALRRRTCWPSRSPLVTSTSSSRSPSPSASTSRACSLGRLPEKAMRTCSS